MKLTPNPCWPVHIHIQINHLNSPGHRFRAFLVIIHQYEIIAFIFPSQEMGAYGVLNISFPPPVCQPLLLLLPSPGWHTLRRSDNVISRKSEILLVSDVRIFHSIPIHPPNIHAFSPLPLPHLTFVGRLLKGKRCFVVEVCVC